MNSSYSCFFRCRPLILCLRLGSGKDDEDCSDDGEDDAGDVDEGGGSVGDEERQPHSTDMNVGE